MNHQLINACCASFLSLIIGQASAQPPQPFTHLEPFSLGMHCSEVKSILLKMSSGLIPGYPYNDAGSKPAGINNAACIDDGQEAAMKERDTPQDVSKKTDQGRTQQGEPFSMALLAQKRPLTISYSSHEVNMDENGLVTTIIMRREWDDLDIKPYAEDVIKELFDRFGKPGVTDSFVGSKAESQGRPKKNLYAAAWLSSIHNAIQGGERKPINFKRDEKSSKATQDQCARKFKSPAEAAGCVINEFDKFFSEVRKEPGYSIVAYLISNINGETMSFSLILEDRRKAYASEEAQLKQVQAEKQLRRNDAKKSIPKF